MSTRAADYAAELAERAAACEQLGHLTCFVIKRQSLLGGLSIGGMSILVVMCVVVGVYAWAMGIKRL